MEGLDELRLGIDRMQRMLGSRRIQARLTEISGIDLTQQAIHVLRVLPDTDGCPIADVARRARMDIGAVSRQLRVLEAAGYVERESSPDHGSVVLVNATAAGVAARRRIEAVQRRQFTEALASWSGADKATIGRLMLRLVEDLQRTSYRAD
jgi:DNA-binding MarR family transcriptional regulator